MFRGTQRTLRVPKNDPAFRILISGTSKGGAHLSDAEKRGMALGMAMAGGENIEWQYLWINHVIMYTALRITK